MKVRQKWRNNGLKHWFITKAIRESNWAYWDTIWTIWQKYNCGFEIDQWGGIWIIGTRSDGSIHRRALIGWSKRVLLFFTNVGCYFIRVSLHPLICSK